MRWLRQQFTLSANDHRTIKYRRVIISSRMVILTTLAAWSDKLLQIMARFGLVSKEEVDEYVYAYTLPLLGWYFGTSVFLMTDVNFGYFVLSVNLWSTARR